MVNFGWTKLWTKYLSCTEFRSVRSRDKFGWTVMRVVLSMCHGLDRSDPSTHVDRGAFCNPVKSQKMTWKAPKVLGQAGHQQQLTLQEDLGLSSSQPRTFSTNRTIVLKWHSQWALTSAQAKQALHATKQHWKIFNELILVTFVRAMNKRFSKTKTYFN